MPNQGTDRIPEQTRIVPATMAPTPTEHAKLAQLASLHINSPNNPVFSEPHFILGLTQNGLAVVELGVDGRTVSTSLKSSNSTTTVGCWALLPHAEGVFVGGYRSPDGVERQGFLTYLPSDPGSQARDLRLPFIGQPKQVLTSPSGDHIAVLTPWDDMALYAMDPLRQGNNSEPLNVPSHFRNGARHLVFVDDNTLLVSFQCGEHSPCLLKVDIKAKELRFKKLFEWDWHYDNHAPLLSLSGDRKILAASHPCEPKKPNGSTNPEQQGEPNIEIFRLEEILRLSPDDRFSYMVPTRIPLLFTRQLVGNFTNGAPIAIGVSGAVLTHSGDRFAASICGAVVVEGSIKNKDDWRVWNSNGRDIHYSADERALVVCGTGFSPAELIDLGNGKSWPLGDSTKHINHSVVVPLTELGSYFRTTTPGSLAPTP